MISACVHVYTHSCAVYICLILGIHAICVCTCIHTFMCAVYICLILGIHGIAYVHVYMNSCVQFTSVYYWEHMVSACVHVYTHSCVQLHMESALVDTLVFSSHPYCFELAPHISLCLAHSARLSNPSVSVPPARGIQQYMYHIFTWILGLKLRPLCVQSKHFTN